MSVGVSETEEHAVGIEGGPGVQNNGNAACLALTIMYTGAVVLRLAGMIRTSCTGRTPDV